MAKAPGPLVWLALLRHTARHEQSERGKAFSSAAAQSLTKYAFKQFGGDVHPDPLG